MEVEEIGIHGIENKFWKEYRFSILSRSRKYWKTVVWEALIYKQTGRLFKGKITNQMCDWCVAWACVCVVLAPEAVCRCIHACGEEACLTEPGGSAAPQSCLSPNTPVSFPLWSARSGTPGTPRHRTRKTPLSHLRQKNKKEVEGKHNHKRSKHWTGKQLEESR